MTHLNETIFAAGIASSYQAQQTASGNFQNDDMLANVCKHNVTRFPYELKQNSPGCGRRLNGHNAIREGL